eukprot:1158658-Pelagomonas_calceolata.AAC.1
MDSSDNHVGKWCTLNTGDGIDYGQRNYDCLGELIADTLSLFEAKGGDDAFINIKRSTGNWWGLMKVFEKAWNVCLVQHEGRRHVHFIVHGPNV